MALPGADGGDTNRDRPLSFPVGAVDGSDERTELARSSVALVPAFVEGLDAGWAS